MRHLRNESATHSRLQGFLEVLRFAKHVVGLSRQLEAFESAWVAGIVRAAAQNRPLRKQSSVLTVSALQYLETILEDETVALVDRYAAGVILSATYSRARFGDLRQIAGIVIDEAPKGERDQLGYLEMDSASHKMRATGNRLGAHLPLVAPLKGLGILTFLSGRHCALFCLHQVRLVIGPRDRSRRVRPSDGSSTCWSEVVLMIASLHDTAAKQPRSPCWPSMGPTQTPGWCLDTTRRTRPPLRCMRETCSPPHSEFWKQCSRTSGMAILGLTAPDRE